MKKKNRLTILFVVLFIGIISAGYLFFNFEEDKYTKIIRQNIIKLKEENRTAKFAEIIPFEWDKAFVIEDPYASNKAIEEIVGVKTNLDRFETELFRRIIFLNKGKFIFDYVYDKRKFRYDYEKIELEASSTVHIVSGTTGKIILKIE